jgi:hypothetical protein
MYSHCCLSVSLFGEKALVLPWDFSLEGVDSILFIRDESRPPEPRPPMPLTAP